MSKQLVNRGLGRPAGAPRRGFSLVELLTVMTIVGILLGVAVAVTNTGSGTRARQAARGELLAMLTRARAEAITTGEPVAVAMVGAEAGPDRARGKAFAIYAVERTEVGNSWEVGEQLQRWTYFSGSAVLLDEESAPRGPGFGANALAQDSTLPVEIFDPERRGKVGLAVPFVAFESTGAVVHPPGSGRIEFLVGEGSWRSGELVITGRRKDGQPRADRLVLSRLSGRAQEVRTEP